MKSLEPRTRFAAYILFVALLAALAVAAFRFRMEYETRRVEIAMDYSDFIQLSQAFNYNPESFLIALRRAGLTSVALTEEQGSDIGTTNRASAITGVSLLDAARLSPISDPTLSQLVRSGKVKPDAIYLMVYDRATFDRYRAMLALHFEPRSVSVLHASAPWVIAVHTQLDYFNNTGLGIPDDQLAMVRRLGLLIEPRFQNDERFQTAQMEQLFASLHGDRRVSTIVFFGLRNQVLGYPDHIDDAAGVFKNHHYVFGSIETYDDSQIQKGNDHLAILIPGQTVRVEAIAKLELDKLRFDEVVSRYVLGVRERNIRVVYLRPYPHQLGDLSIEATNVEMVRQIADQLRDEGFSFGHAAPIRLYRGNNPVLVGIVTLAVPSIFVLLLGAFGIYRRWLAVAAYAVTIGLYAAGYFLNHDMFARSAIALVGALLFCAAAFLALANAFTKPPAQRTGSQVLASLRWTLLATGIALVGALVVVGIMSSPLAMEEIERFRGVKLVLVLPSLIALAMYVFSGRYGAPITRARDVFLSPLRSYHLVALLAIAAGGVLLLMRSGNQSDVAPSDIELSVRHGLTEILNVRPRFKEFLIGFPCMMLAPALLASHRKYVGWLLALGIGVGIGDIVDTFSHLHTALEVSLLRVFNGFVIGAVIGIAAILIYRWLVRRFAPST